MNARILLFVGVAAVAFAIGSWYAFTLGERAEPEEPAGGGYVLDAPRPLPAFELTDDGGESFTERDFQGHWSVLYFGFTYCPDVCPTSLGVMAEVERALGGVDGLDDRYYLVSVDPARDTPERLREYVTWFAPDFRGLTGTFDQLDLLTNAAGAVYRVPDAPEGEDYLVAHSSTLTVIDPQGRVHAIFTSPFDPAAIARRLEDVARDWRDT